MGTSGTGAVEAMATITALSANADAVAQASIMSGEQGGVSGPEGPSGFLARVNAEAGAQLVSMTGGLSIHIGPLTVDIKATGEVAAAAGGRVGFEASGTKVGGVVRGRLAAGLGGSVEIRATLGD